MESQDIEDIEVLLDSLQNYLRTHSGHDIPLVQRGVLYACLHTPNAPYRKMPKLLLNASYGSYSEKNLKNAGSKIFQTLSTVFKEDIKKSNCHLKLLSWYRERQRQAAVNPLSAGSSQNTVQLPANLLPLQCLEQDVSELVQKIRSGHRILSINGAARTGKTYLLHSLITRIGSEFEEVIQCEAADFQTVARLYDRVSKQNSSDIENASAVLALAELLRTRRILLAIDHTECLFDSEHLAGEFRPDCTGYGEWLRRLLASPVLTGCLVWVGREPPKCFDILPAFCCRVSRLQSDDAALLLKAQGIDVGAIANWEYLVKFCGGNPGWLLRQASHLQRLSPEGIPQFLASPTLDLNVTETLQRVLARLSRVEQLLLVWLLLKPMSYGQAQYLDSPGVLPQQWLDALASLERRDLIRHDANRHYRLDSPLLERVLANRVVEQVTAALVNTEVNAASLNTLSQYPLFYGATPASRQIWQWQYLLQETKHRFQNYPGYGFRGDQTKRLQDLLRLVRNLSPAQPGYAVSNVLNLAIALEIPLVEFDLSELPLRHVDLRRAKLHGANLEGCTFEHTLLPLNLTGKLVADMDADGGAIAVGDEDGHLFYWQRENGSFRLHAFRTLPDPINAILFKAPGILILISKQTVYSWSVSGEQALQTIIELPESATCLAYGHWGHIAVGLSNGQIVIWDELKQQSRVLNAHNNPVDSLVFSPTGQALASIGAGNRVLIWSMASENGATFPSRELSSGSRICGAIAWERESLVWAEVDASRIYLRVGTSLVQEHSLHDGDIIALYFSKNGRHLAGSSNNGLIFCWDWHTQHTHTIDQLAIYGEHHPSERIIPGQVMACTQGRWLLALPGHHIQLYDLQTNEIFWEVQALSPSCPSCNLRSAQNLTPAEQDVMRSLGADLSD